MTRNAALGRYGSLCAEPSALGGWGAGALEALTVVSKKGSREAGRLFEENMCGPRSSREAGRLVVENMRGCTTESLEAAGHHLPCAAFAILHLAHGMHMHGHGPQLSLATVEF